MATNAEVAKKARRTQFGLVGGFVAIVLFASLFSRTERALLGAAIAPPSAFAAVLQRPAPPARPAARAPRLLLTEPTDAFPRPAGFVRDRTPAPVGVGARPAPAGTVLPPDVPSDVAGQSAAPSGTGEAPGAGTTGGFPALAGTGGAGFPGAGSFPVTGGGTGGGTTPGTGTGTTPGTGTDGGTTPGNGGGTPGNGGGTPAPTPTSTPTPGGNGGTPVSPVPEPATWATLIVGFFGIGAVLRRRRGRAASGEAAAGIALS